MDIQSLLQTLQDTTLATLIRESDSGFPALESLHVIGIALAVSYTHLTLPTTPYV